MIRVRDIAKEKAVELGINPKAAAFACFGIGECIREKLKEANLGKELIQTEEELKEKGFLFNLHMMGKISVNYNNYKTIKNKINNAKSRKNNSRI